MKKYKFDNWDDAERFIVQAETSGEVFSLNGFQNALNREEINITNKLVYITNKY